MNPRVTRKKEITNIRAQIKEIETKKKKKKKRNQKIIKAKRWIFKKTN